MPPSFKRNRRHDSSRWPMGRRPRPSRPPAWPKPPTTSKGGCMVAVVWLLVGITLSGYEIARWLTA